MPNINQIALVLARELSKPDYSVSESGKEVVDYIESELSVLSPEEKLSVLEALEEFLAAERPRTESDTGVAPSEASRLMLRFLGRGLETEGLSQEEVFDRFAISLNTLFDSINGIMVVINRTLLGEEAELATIRKIIGSNIDGDGNDVLIGEYLERIQKSFLLAHTSFQEASSTLLCQVLGELDPESLSKSLPSGFKFGALRKAELYDVYDEKYSKIKRWYESGHHREQLLRTFESCCQKEINKL